MKFSTVDNWINENSSNSLDLIHFDEIKENPKKGFPAFIIKGEYIKTITQIPWVDFFNFTSQEQEEKVRLFSAFLSSLKTPTQIFVHSKNIDTSKYVKETLEQVEKSPYLSEKIKKEIIRWLPQTLMYIQKDWESTPFKKEYYIITSSKIRFTWDYIQEDKENEQNSKLYSAWIYKGYSKIEIENYASNFNRYYQEIIGYLLQILDENAKFLPFSKEEQIIWLFSELNNWLDRKKMPIIKNML